MTAPDLPTSVAADVARSLSPQEQLATGAIEVLTQARRRHEGLYLAAYGIAFLVAYGTILSIAIVALPLKATALAGDGSTALLSVTSAIGAVAALIANPLVGRLSDRTTSSWGMRRPWLLLCLAFLLAGLITCAYAPGAAVLIIGWSAAQAGANGLLAALVASVTDQFAPSRRGFISGILGAGQTFGIVLITFVIQAVGSSIPLMFLVPAGVTAVAVLTFTIALRDRRLARAERPAADWATAPGTFWVNPIAFPDFAFAWWSRATIFAGIAAVNVYMAYYLITVLHVDPQEVATHIFEASLVLAVVSSLFAISAGRISDRIGRRKPFVIVAALVFSVGLVIIASAGSFNTFLIGFAIFGAGQGIYLAVDLAMVTQVLPNRQDAGKDLGVLNIASTLPSPIITAIAPAILAIGAANGGQNYSSLFFAAAILALAGAALILPIRKVR